MYQLRLRTIPVLENGEIAGLITDKDLVDPSLVVTEAVGGKRGYITNVIGRKGLPSGTRVTSRRVNENDSSATSTKLSQTLNLNVDVGSYALPHPFKSAKKCELSRRYLTD